MDAEGLPARISYAVVALAVGGAVGFYSSIFLLPKLATDLPVGDSYGYGMFQIAVCVAVELGFSAFLVALTLPWRRRKKRRGRTGRIALACGVVLVATLGFAGLGHTLLYDFLFATWLAYVMAFTFVRYGVLDQERRRKPSIEAPSSANTAG